MGWYGLMVDLEGRHCVVIGSGPIVERKVRDLLEASAIVEIISPKLGASLRSGFDSNNLIWHQREYRYGDLVKAWLVIAASDDSLTNDTIQREAKSCGALVYVVDRPNKGNVQIPVSIQRGDMRLWISTGGVSPALVRRIRVELLARYGPSYAVWIKILKEARAYLQHQEISTKRRQEILQELTSADWEVICRRGHRAARTMMNNWLKKQLVISYEKPTDKNLDNDDPK